MRTVAHIIAELGGPTIVGRACGFASNQGARGSDMLRRGSIPVRYWPMLLAWSERNGNAKLTYKDLVEAHAHRGPQQRSEFMEAHP